MTENRKPGRPRVQDRLKKIPVGYKLPRWMVEWIRAQDTSAAVLIERAMVEHYGLWPPD